MRWLIAVAVAVGTSGCVGCGWKFETHCDGTGFGRGVDSVLPVDCALIKSNFDYGASLVGQNTHVTESDYRAKMRHVHVIIRSIYSWNSPNGVVIGENNFNENVVDKFGISMLHESMHAWDQISELETVGGVLAYPVEAVNEMNHDGWDQSCDTSNNIHCNFDSMITTYENDCQNNNDRCTLLQKLPDGATAPPEGW